MNMELIKASSCGAVVAAAIELEMPTVSQILTHTSADSLGMCGAEWQNSILGQGSRLGITGETHNKPHPMIIIVYLYIQP